MSGSRYARPDDQFAAERRGEAYVPRSSTIEDDLNSWTWEGDCADGWDVDRVRVIICERPVVIPASSPARGRKELWWHSEPRNGGQRSQNRDAERWCVFKQGTDESHLRIEVREQLRDGWMIESVEMFAE